MRGRKKSNPKIKDLAQGKARPDSGTSAGSAAKVEQLYPAPPKWISDPNAIAEWKRLVPELIRRKKYLHLFENELARYCVEFGVYVDAVEQMRVSTGKRKGRLDTITLSAKNVQMLSMLRVVARQSHDMMRQLAGDLGLNPVDYQRIENLQLDLFADAPAGGGTDNQPRGQVTKFGGFRRDAAG